MKAMFNRVLAIFLMGVIFITTTGFGLLERSCLMNSKKTASVFEKSCCTKKKTTPAETDETIIKSAVCCQSQVHTVDINLAPAVEKVANLLEKAFFTVVEAAVRLFTSALHSAEAVLNAADSSPPLAGKDISIRHHSLLI
jgi:hypothetical protein